MNATTQFNYFEDAFATAAALQVYDFIPLIIEKMCYGCCIRSTEDFDHAVCQLKETDLVRIGFHQAFDMINKEQAEEFFFSSIQPKREFIYEQSWYESLWTNQDWMQLVQDKAVQLRQRLMNF